MPAGLRRARRSRWRSARCCCRLNSSLFSPVLRWAYNDGAAALSADPHSQLHRDGDAAGAGARRDVPDGDSLVRARIRRAGAGEQPLYFVNTVGAAIGALLAGFVLIPSIGMSGTIYVAMAGTALAAIVVSSSYCAASPSTQPVAPERRDRPIAQGGKPRPSRAALDRDCDPRAFRFCSARPRDRVDADPVARAWADDVCVCGDAGGGDRRRGDRIGHRRVARIVAREQGGGHAGVHAVARGGDRELDLLRGRLAHSDDGGAGTSPTSRTSISCCCAACC